MEVDVADDEKIYLGTNKDFSISYDSANDRWVLRDEINAKETILPKDKDINLSAIAYDDLATNTKRYPVGIRIAADSAAGDIWERAAFYAPIAVTVIDAGIVPDAGFGQAGDYATLEVQNKGTDGSGTTSLVSKSFDAAVSAYDYTSLGAISNESISAGEVLSFKKTITGAGEIVPASLLVLYIERAA